MGTLDAAIVVGSLVGLVALGGWLAARQKASEDYYLGGRRLPAWALGASLAANQVSAISLVGAPAFVALRAGGGLVWLQYELAVPLAMIVLVGWGVPFLRRAGGASVYSAVEARFGRAPRRALAVLFMVSRGAGAGVILYASALVVAAVTGWSLSASLLVVGGVAVVYTSLGGLVADVVTDVAQLGLLWGGTALATVILALRLDAEGALFSGLDAARLEPLDFLHHGIGDGATFSFWPMLVGGLFLYVSYYGCDQTQAQRILAARSHEEARRALAVASFVRFPLVCTYCLLGVLLGDLLAAEPAFAARLAGQPADALVPQFVAWALPVGVRGIAVAGILAAALSSLDSALNSLSAVLFEEVLAARQAVKLGAARLATVAWGALAIAGGYVFSLSGETTIELVNRVGSLLYGPILGVFVLAWGCRRATGRSALAGVAAGVAVNLVLAIWVTSLSWLWWNVTGLAATVGVGVAAGRVSSASALAAHHEVGWRPHASWLGGLFAVILTLLAAITLAL